MDYLARLKKAYRDHAGMDVVSGLNARDFGNYAHAPFTHYLQGGESQTEHLGISLWELLVLERYCRAQPPRSIFIIGNGLGWSAIALAMMNPDAFVVVIDPTIGIELTNRLAFRERLSCIAVPGWSPADNARIIRDYCPCTPDLVLIDGLHSNEQIVLDFNATFAVTGRAASYFFHDIVLFNLFDGLATIAETGRAAAMTMDLLLCTPSGMAVATREDAPPAVRDAIGLFSVSADALSAIGKLSQATVPAAWLAYARS